MPVLLPPPMPRFSCSITRTSGNRSRTSATVPSVEPLSTTITSRSRTDARHCSIHGSAFHVTTTTDTSGTAPRHGALRPWGAPVEYLLPEDHGESRQGEQDRHHEEEEAAGEGGVGVDSEIPEEADEERLAHAEAVDRERHEHDEEEQRAEDDVREEREVDADGAAGRVDREHARQLQSDADGADDEQRPGVLAIAVNPLVDGTRGPLDAEALCDRQSERQAPPHRAGEEDESGQDRCDHEDRLGPQVGPDRVPPNRQEEADACEQERHRAAKGAFEQHGAGDRGALARMPPHRLDDP